jgi:hypothetical protein
MHESVLVAALGTAQIKPVPRKWLFGNCLRHADFDCLRTVLGHDMPQYRCESCGRTHAHGIVKPRPGSLRNWNHAESTDRWHHVNVHDAGNRLLLALAATE